MQLRDRQRVFVDRCLEALDEHDNTLGVAPTGSGKTVMLSALSGETLEADGHHIILQHRDELVAQNRRTYNAINPDIPTMQFDADHKDWASRGGASFAMVQTLIRNLDLMPPCDTLIIDEAHHAAAKSYVNIVMQAKSLNPKVKIFGVTATPNRGDKTSLVSVFDNCADMISAEELVQAGHLVPPRGVVIDLGNSVTERLEKVRRTNDDFDMAEVEAIMDDSALNSQIIEHWEHRAKGRQTVIFCATIQHAKNVAEAFSDAGHEARVISSETQKFVRKIFLSDFEKTVFPIIVNVAVLTEGWDCPPCSCVILLRPCSYKSTMIQMVGRGMRKIDPEKHPGIIKDDCLVLDFGITLHRHGSILEDVNLEASGTIDCPNPACEAKLPKLAKQCPICGEDIPAKVTEEHTGGGTAEEPDGTGYGLENFVMSEIDLLDASPFRWMPLWNGHVFAASSFRAWGFVMWNEDRQTWIGICGRKGQPARTVGESAWRKTVLASADDYLREFGSVAESGKAKSWLKKVPTSKQIAALSLSKAETYSVSRYEASCLLSFKFNERAIRRKF